MKFYLYLIGLVIFDLLALISIKYWYLKNSIIYLIIGMFSFSITALFLGLSLKYEGVAIANIIWVALSAILSTIIGYYLFKEPIALHQFIGIAIIIMGLVVIQWK